MGFQEQVANVFRQKENSIVRVFGGHQVLDCAKETLEINQVNVGTGFFISREGHIMTTADIVKDAQCFWVDYKGVPYPAELIGKDGGKDGIVTNVAIIKVINPPSDIEFLHLGECMTLPKPATMLIAITCQLGMDPGPSLGMVTGWHTAFYDTVFPTTVLRSNIPSDAGEDGSPVFDLMGRFVGIIISSVECIRSSFILPASAVMRIRDSLIFSGKVTYAFMGIELDKAATIAARTHIVVGDAPEGTPAHTAGIKKGDVLLEFDGTPINHVMDLHNATFFARPGQMVVTKVRRGNKELSIPVRMGERPSSIVIEEKTSVVNLCEKESTSNATSKDLVNPVNQKENLISSLPKEIEKVAKKGNFWHDYFKR